MPCGAWGSLPGRRMLSKHVQNSNVTLCVKLDATMMMFIEPHVIAKSQA
jgi:hypothetical protein